MRWDAFTLTRFDVYFIVLLVGFVVLKIFKQLPDVEGFRKLISAADDKGGNILLLAGFSAWFFSVAVGMFYYAYNMIGEKKIDGKDAIMLMGLSFATGTAFGGAFSAMLKTMTGNMTVAPPHASGTGVPSSASSTVTSTDAGGTTTRTITNEATGTPAPPTPAAPEIPPAAGT